MSTKQIKSGIIYGDQNFLVPPNLNFGEFVLKKILAHDRDKTAMINGETGESITYGEMAQKIVNIASSLLRLGVKVGDVVAISSENRIEYMLTSLAIFSCGAIVTYFNNSYTKDDFIHALHVSKPTYIFLSGEVFKNHYETIKSTKMIKKYILYDDVSRSSDFIQFDDLVNKHTDIKSYKAHDFKDSVQTCLILYSSGTTGLAKGAKLNHLNLIIGCQNVATTKNLILLTVAPWSSTMGLICTLREIVYGRRVVFLPKYVERVYLATIEKYKIGMLLVAPPLIVMLYKSTIANEFDISTVEILYSGGAPIDPKSIAQLKIRFPNIKYVLQGYGMTEATGAVTEDLDTAPKEGSVGLPAAGIILKVADPETDKVLGRNEPGEIRIKGAVVFGGYIGKDLKDDLDEEGFYKTGDIAYYDDEGYFYIVDRIKELIKYKAWQVAPSELEALILQHPAVKDVGVTGAPDALAGELPTAFVVKQPNANITEQEIINFVSDKVSPWKRLRGGVIFLKEIPKTASGKILRRELKRLVQNRNPQKIPASKL